MTRHFQPDQGTLRLAPPGHAAIACAAVFLVAAGAALLFAPLTAFPPWFFARLTGLGALGHALLLLLPGLLFRHERHPGEHRALRERGSRVRLQVLLGVTGILTLAGSLGLYRLNRVGIDYDKAMHVVVPLLLTFGLARFVFWRHDVTVRRALVVAIATVGMGMAGWEVVEYLSDRYLGTAAFGQEGSDVEVDTAFDVGLGIVGTIGGALVARSWRGVRSVR